MSGRQRFIEQAASRPPVVGAPLIEWDLIEPDLLELGMRAAAGLYAEQPPEEPTVRRFLALQLIRWRSPRAAWRARL